jgi:hypothetical protein
MTDRNEIIRQVEERLGSGGTPRLAEAMFIELKDLGYIVFDPALGYMFEDEEHLALGMWDELLAGIPAGFKENK